MAAMSSWCYADLMTAFAVRRYDEILKDVQDARAWYASIGLRTAGTRLELIETRVHELISDFEVLAP